MNPAAVSPARIRSVFLIGQEHPALPGHFPGTPVVPGVVLLDQVLAALAIVGMPPEARTEWPQVKFQSPLLPGQLAQLTMTLSEGEARFEIEHDAERIAQGSVRWSKT